MSVRTFLFVSIALSATFASAHPGQLAKDGCHRCKKNCAPFGDDGERHCHDAEPKTVDNPPVKIVTVKRIVDGDTLHVRSADGKTEETIRILGIDCPESRKNTKCQADADCDAQVVRGKRATKRAKALLQKQTVVLTTWRAAFEKDRHQRTLAYVHLPDGTDVGETLVKEGLCADYGDKYPHPRSVHYRSK